MVDDSARAAILEQLLSIIGLSGSHHPAAAAIRSVLQMYWTVGNKGMYKTISRDLEKMQRSVLSYLQSEPNKSGPVYSAVCELVDAAYSELSESHSSQAALCSACIYLERIRVSQNHVVVAVNDEEVPKTTSSTSLLQALHESFIDEFGPASNSCTLEDSKKDKHQQTFDNAEIPRIQGHFNDGAATVVALEDEEEPPNRAPVNSKLGGDVAVKSPKKRGRPRADPSIPRKRKERLQYPGIRCCNCSISESAQWRRLSHDGEIACNACWIHYRTYGEHRPKIFLYSKSIRKRRTKAEMLEARQKELAASAKITADAVAPSPMAQPALLHFLQKYPGLFVVPPVALYKSPNTPLQ